jgi:AraC-like DNA-binding protein
MRSPDNPPRGILNFTAGQEKFTLARFLPGDDLRAVVEHYWVVRWDLRGQEPYVQETLPYPSVHLVVERGRSEVVGVQTGKFRRLLEGEGHVFGVRFKPGAFYWLVGWPVARLTDRSMGLGEVFGVAGAALEERVLAEAEDEARVKVAEAFLRERLPAEEDAQVAVVQGMVACIAARQEMTKVDDLVRLLGVNKRAVQRLFQRYVGVSPKWVIQRYRLHEVAERLAAGEAVAWPEMVVELGYTDQAHLIKDFKMLVGRTPAEYARGVSCR